MRDKMNSPFPISSRVGGGSETCQTKIFKMLTMKKMYQKEKLTWVKGTKTDTILQYFSLFPGSSSSSSPGRSRFIFFFRRCAIRFLASLCTHWFLLRDLLCCRIVQPHIFRTFSDLLIKQITRWTPGQISLKFICIWTKMFLKYSSTQWPREH